MVSVNREACIGCGKCEIDCPVGAIQLDNDGIAEVSEDCADCRVCIEICPVSCITD